ncbi:MAG: cytochrome c [Magnetococcus sp. YQC-5]
MNFTKSMQPRLTLPLGVVCLSLLALPGQAQAAGEQVFNDKKCTECHYTKGPSKENTIAEKLAQKGPELWYAGDKFQAPWLAKWLSDPKPIRPLKMNSLTEKNAGDHPKLSEAEAKEVSEFLMGLKSGQVKAGVITPSSSVKGKQVFAKKMPCSACHPFPDSDGKVTGGLTAPTFVGAKERLNPDWILAYMTNPKLFKPVKSMPVFTGILKDKEMEDVSSYIANFQ